MRLIDADALKEMGATCFARRNKNGKLEAIISIDNAPTVEPDLKEIYQEGHYDGHREGYEKAINEDRPQGEWLCPNCYLYEQVKDDYCQCAGECTIGCRECKYFKRKGGAE